MYSSSTLAPGVTFTSTGTYSGFFTTDDPERRFGFDHEGEYPAIVKASAVPHRHPLTFDEAQAEAVVFFEERIRNAMSDLNHVRGLSAEDFA